MNERSDSKSTASLVCLRLIQNAFSFRTKGGRLCAVLVASGADGLMVPCTDGTGRHAFGEALIPFWCCLFGSFRGSFFCEGWGAISNDSTAPLHLA